MMNLHHSIILQAHTQRQHDLLRVAQRERLKQLARRSQPARRSSLRQAYARIAALFL